MRDAIGGTVNIFLIAVFMVVISGYMAFNISYVKAFKVKNKIIDLIEQYEGNCHPEDSTNTCTTKINAYMVEIGYSTGIKGNALCSTQTDKDGKIVSVENCHCNETDGYCITKKSVKSAESQSSISASDDSAERAYYTVATQVNIDLPIIRNVLPNLKAFTVTGDSKVIRVND